MSKIEVLGIEYYQVQADEDLKMEEETLDLKVYLIPNLHAKWVRYLYNEAMFLTKIEKQLLESFRKKYYFYLNDYSYTVDKKHVEWHIESDETYSEELYKVNKQKHKVKYLEQMVRKVNGLSFDIKNMVEWRKFLAGV
jgi:hypothetical protein